MPRPSFLSYSSQIGPTARPAATQRASGSWWLAACAIVALALTGATATIGQDVAAGTEQAGTERAGAAVERILSEALADELEVRLVEVKVRVTDKKGVPIAGLGEDDFELLVDDQATEIDHFVAEVPAPRRTAPAAEPALDSATAEQAQTPALPAYVRAEQPEFLVVLVDKRWLETDELEAVRDELRAFLLDGLPPSTQVMLVAADEGLEVLEPFSADPSAVVADLDAIEIEAGKASWRQEYDWVMREIQNRDTAGYDAMFRRTGGANDGAVPQGTDVPLGGGPDGAPGGEPGGDVGGSGRGGGTLSQLVEADPTQYLLSIDALHRKILSQLQITAGQIVQVVQASAGLPGRKTVLYVGGTLPTNAGRTLFELWQETFSNLEAHPDFAAPINRDLNRDERIAWRATDAGSRFGETSDLFEEVSVLANAAGITFHGVEASALGRSRRFLATYGDVENATSGSRILGTATGETRQSVRQDTGLYILADRTGGRSLEGSRKFEDFFAGVASDFRTYYTLAFTTRPGEPTVRQIEVRLKDDGRFDDDRRMRTARLHHRRHVAVKPLDQEQSEATIAALAMDLPPANPLEVEVLAGPPTASADGKRVVQLSIRVPMSKLALVPDQQAHAGQLSIYVAAGDLEHGVGRVKKAVVPVRIPNQDLLTAFGRRVDYRLDVELPAVALGGGAGEALAIDRVAVTVRDDYRPSGSTVTAQIGTWTEGLDEGGSDS